MKPPWSCTLLEALAALCGMLFTLVAMVTIIALLLLTGCVRHEITAPQFDQALAAVRSAHPATGPAAVEAKPCPRLELPPIPQDVVIDIKGDQVTANAGGEQLLRGYVSARSLLRGAP